MIFIILVPFTLGRNILEVTLIEKKEIYGYSLFDVIYFISFYLSDVVLLLIFQHYLSQKISKKEQRIKLTKNCFFASVAISMFVVLTAIRSINHEFGSLIIFSSVVLIKFVLIFLVPYLINFNKHKNTIIQIILSSTLFQAILIVFEQIKKGNIGKFIESTLPGIENGTYASESVDLLRANGTFNEPNIAAIFLLTNICIILPYFLNQIKTKKNYNNYFYLFIIFIILSAIIFTGSRSIYFLTFLAIVYFFFRNKNIFIKSFKILFSKLPLKITFFILLISITPYLFSRIDTLKDVLTEKGSFSYRSELNRYSLQLSKNNLLGIGINMTPYYLVKNFKTVDSNLVIFDQAPAHNIFIQIITETGILGLITFIIFLLFCFKKFIINPKFINKYTISSIAFLLAAQFHPAFTTHQEIFSLFLLYLSFANILKIEKYGEI